MNIKRRFYLIILCLALMRVAWADSTKGILLDKIIANVDNQIILQSELETAYQQYLLQGLEAVPDLKCKVLSQLITNKMLLSKAQKEGVVVPQETIAQALNDRMQSLLVQVASEEELVQYWGKSIEEIKSVLRESIKEQLMLDSMRNQLIANISVTPKEVKAFFEALPSQEQPYCPTEVVVRQIVQYSTFSSQETDTLIAQLNTLKVRLQEGEDFGVLAREYSQDAGSAPQGGDLGFWRLGELDAAYEAAALALQPGEISEPVMTELGIHLIQLITREQDRYNSRHILLKPRLDIQVAKTVLNQLREDVLAGKMTFEQAAQKFSDDSLTDSVGGLLTSKEGEKKMLIDDLPPDVYFVVEELTPGAISDPIPFTTADGREAVQLILLEERIAPHPANLAQDYAKIQQMLMDKQRTTVLKNWLEDIQASVSMNVAPEYQHCELFK